MAVDGVRPLADPGAFSFANEMLRFTNRDTQSDGYGIVVGTAKREMNDSGCPAVGTL